MKKLGIMTAILIMFSSLFPQNLFANGVAETELDIEENVTTEEQLEIEQGATEIESVEKIEQPAESIGVEEDSIVPEIHKVEYNEFGIKKGTMVNGEDISELSEWELQYIPEGWRDGIVESEHPEEDQPNQSIMGAKKSFPNVNNYIQSKKFSTAKVNYSHNSDFTKFNYRNGFGKVEGVVAHETANSRSNIAGEIAYMSRNHKNAFVHAFVNHDQIIEIHPPELGAWGAGRIANQRFIHVELVRMHSFDEFARSINNYSDYIANLLYKYDLGVQDADNNRGQGTLWSHRAVSNFLGYTNHVDPHGYFESWGYNWKDFVTLVRSKHNALVANKQQYTSKLGHIKSSTTRIYEDPMKLGKYITAGSNNTNEVYYIKQKAEINGEKYYLMSRQPSNSNGTLGWINAKDVSAQEHEEKSVANEKIIIGGNDKAYTKAWGGKRNLVFDNLSSFDGATISVDLVEVVGNNIWYKVTLNGKQVWVKPEGRSINQNEISKESVTSRMGHIRNSNVNIYPKLNDDSSKFIAGQTYTNAVYYIKKEAEVNDQTFYLISSNPSSVKGVVGWVNAQDLSSYPHLVADKNEKTFYVNGQGSAYRKAWGGSKDLIYNDLGKYKKQLFNVHLTESIGNSTWHRGELNGKIVWINSNLLSPRNEIATSQLGHIRNGNVKIYPEFGNESSAITAKATYTNAVYYIKKDKVVNEQRYHLISKSPSSVKGVIGWAKAEDIQTQQHAVVDKTAKTFVINGTGSAYSKAWGGSKDAVFKNLSPYIGQEFNVHLTESVGNNIWYRGTLNGKIVWIHANLVSSIKEMNTSQLGHIRNGNVVISSVAGNSSSTITAGSTLTNAVYYIKKDTIINSQHYHLLSRSPSSVRGIIGWAKAEDIQTQPHTVIDKKTKSFIIKGSGSAYSKAWGGSKDFVFNNLSAYKNQEFNVHLTESVGENIWYRGNLGGKTVWIHDSYLSGK